ncbi:MAG: CpaF family protein [Chloroflexota bacterium]
MNLLGRLQPRVETFAETSPEVEKEPLQRSVRLREPQAAVGVLVPEEVPQAIVIPHGQAADEVWHIAKGTGHRFRDLKMAIANRILEDLGPDFRPVRTPEAEQDIYQHYGGLVRESEARLSETDQRALWEAVLDEVLGYGPIEPLLREDSVTEVMVNGHGLIYAERKGRLSETDVLFEDEEHVLRVVDRILKPLGRRVDRKWPMADARLPDGSRVNIIVSPCALSGPTITIRKFSRKPFTVEDLIRFGSLTGEVADFLRACVVARLNVVVAGGTGSGKTTLLNVLSSFIPNGERIVTIEDSAELQLNQRHVVTLEARPADADGTGKVSIRDLVVNSLRMRPERIVVGECRSGEALDMLQAMNTGHDGSLTTLHANTPRDALSRLETMVLMSGMNLPMKAIRAQVSSAIDLIVLQSRLRDGSRKITHVTEVQGMEGDTIVIQDIFLLKEAGMDDEGRLMATIEPTGMRPKFITRLETKGIMLPPSVFGVQL